MCTEMPLLHGSVPTAVSTCRVISMGRRWSCLVEWTGRPSTVNTGTGQNYVEVQDTNVPLTINGGSNDTVDIGNAGSVQGIAGPVTVSNPMHLTKLTVDDSADSAARANKNVSITSAKITGLA